MGVLSRRTVLAGAGVASVAAVAGAGATLIKPGGEMLAGTSRARPIPSDTDFPKAVDVAVIGGGNMGVATALTLAERGVSVAVFEKGAVAGEASGRSFGLVENLGSDLSKIELVGRSKQLWAEMNARTGHETGYRKNGLVMVIEDEGQRAWLTEWMSATRGMPGCDARFLSNAELAAIYPGLVTPGMGAVFQPSDGTAEPQLFAPAMALAARAHGARVFQGCAVRGIERTGGRVSGVVTEKGTVACQAVVLTGGTWTPLFLRSLGVSIPQFDGGSSSVSVSLAHAPNIPAIVGTSGWRPLWNGRISMGTFYVPTPIVPDTFRYLPKLLPIMGDALKAADPIFSPSTFWEKLRTPSHWALDKPSPFEKYRVLVSDIVPHVWKGSFEAARDAYPAFAQAQIAETWGGFISTMIDNLPVIDRVEEVPGMVVATGFNFGLAAAPATGEALADMVMNRKPKVELHQYRISRFFDGSKLSFKP